MKISVNIMTAREAIYPFITDDVLKVDYKDELAEIDFDDDFSVQNFLDNVAVDVERVSEEVCEFLELDWQDGWYISTWNHEYLSK